MLELYIAFVVGIYNPTSPHYNAYIEDQGHPVRPVTSLVTSLEECQNRLKVLEQSAADNGVTIVRRECISVTYPDPAKVTGV